MERTYGAAHRWRLILLGAGAAAAAVLLRDVLRLLTLQVLAAAVMMALALPLCRLLERRLPGGVAAAAALGMVLAGAAAVLVGIVPAVVKQVQQLAASLPGLLEQAKAMLQRTAAWLEGRGMAASALREGLLGPVTDAAATLLSRGMGMVSGLLGSISQVVLSPLLAFYLLRDRRRIASGLTLLLPVHCRARGVRAAREMKRETAAYLRGQLLLSLAVGAMTGCALLLLGVPGWLMLGLLMGVMELVPYIGPVIAGAPAVLMALQGGWGRALLTLAVLLVIQETEGTVLSPRLVGSATSLHPLAVLLLVSAGGMIGGTWGMVLVIPLVVSVRGAARGWRE